MYRCIEPEVAGGLGKETLIDNSVHPPIVKMLHFEFEGWLEDDILETFPCYIVTESLKNKIEEEELTGITFDNLFVTKSLNFFELYPNKQLPRFYWAIINGVYAKHDFFLGTDNRLVISESAYKLFCGFNIHNAIVEELR